MPATSLTPNTSYDTSCAETYADDASGIEIVCELRAPVGAPVEVGETPAGRRRIIPILGGTFEGPELKGRVSEGGADFQLIDREGVFRIEARYIMETEGGERICVVNRGVRLTKPEGESVGPPSVYFRTTPVFETSAPRLAWMNRSVFVTSGERYPEEVVLRFWLVSGASQVNAAASGARHAF